MANDNKIELISPAGNLEKMKTALAFGADAVYAGIPEFSLRTRINDFNVSSLKKAVLYCHSRKKKIYVTLNIFAHNRHLKKIPPYIKVLKNMGVDALIISDPGVLSISKKEWPGAKIHLSTQANCTNWQAIKFWAKMGVKRIILSREVSLKEIKEIRNNCPKIELEYFVHGAMCLAYSGRCLLSKYFLNRSGNLGDCVQPCRWRYAVRSGKKEERRLELAEVKRPGEILELVEEEHGSYILNSKDLCLVKYLDKLKEAGINAYKIEGRAKSVYYQAVSAGIYSYAAHNKGRVTKKEANFLFNELNTKLVHRGYTTGFLLGEKGEQNLDESHVKIGWEFCGQVVESLKLPVFSGAKVKNYQVKIKVHNTIKKGDKIEIVRPKYDIIKTSVKKLFAAETGQEISEAHGGRGQEVIIHLPEDAPPYSVARRKITQF